jgi:uncharacterized membrane protein SpoIIM required for sporulation
MLEILISPRAAEKNPFGLFFIGLLYSSLSLFLVSIITKGDAVLLKHASVLLVTFTTIFSIPFIHSLIRAEAIEEATEEKSSRIFSRHSRALLALLFLFLGFLVAFSFWYVILPQDSVMTNFGSQTEKFCSISSQSMQQCMQQFGANDFTKEILTGKVTGMGDVQSILLNNLYVLLFTLLFSLAFGAGAIFILAWNASVIAAAIGILARVSFSQFSMAFLGYMFHGVPEIASYLVIALAGGIISTAFIRKDFRHEGRRLFVDISLLVVTAMLLLIIAAFMEVYVTPLLFG